MLAVSKYSKIIYNSSELLLRFYTSFLYNYMYILTSERLMLREALYMVKYNTMQ